MVLASKSDFGHGFIDDWLSRLNNWTRPFAGFGGLSPAFAAGDCVDPALMKIKSVYVAYDVLLMSMQLFFLTQVQFCHSMLCISILFHVIAERVQFYVLLEHLMNIWFCFWHEKSRPMHYQVSILGSAVGRD